MTEFKKKNKYPFWHSSIMIVVLFCILLFFSFKIIKLFDKERETSINKEIELENLDELRERELALNSYLEKLETKDGIEDIIRNKFQVALPEEKVVVIIDEEESVFFDNDTSSRSSRFWRWVSGVF